MSEPSSKTMKMIKRTHIFILIAFILVLNSCNEKEKWRHIELYPKNGSQTITVITKGTKRYFMNGKHNEVPKDNYILIDISNVDRLGDGVSVCWNKHGKYKWKVSNAYGKLLVNKLDSTMFLYNQPIGKYGEPTSAGYEDENCGGLAIREKRKPRGNLKVKYI